jgi:hypothetical protein
MLECLRYPPPEFADVVRAHFKLKRDEILSTVGRWVEDAQELTTSDYLVMEHNGHTLQLFQTNGYRASLLALFYELRDELAKLE